MTHDNTRARLLVVDDEERIRTILAAVLRNEGYEVVTARDGLDALAKVDAYEPDVVIVDLQMPRLDGLETIGRFKDRLPSVVTIVLTAHGSIETAVQAMKRGAYDYLTKPYDNEQLLMVVNRAVERRHLSDEVGRLKRQLGRTGGIEEIMGDSPTMQAIRQQIKRIAESDATVLIEGESGTGKELAARAIHFESKRRDSPLVVVDCAAIPSHLVESEFFGHERGAFTDAKERRIGKFEEAEGGSIFLDEIGELPQDSQSRLLRVLQEREFVRIGGNVSVRVNVRVIAATNKDLEARVQESKFREDLFFRLNVLKLHMPALREHVEDLPIYVQHFLHKHSASQVGGKRSASSDALKFLCARDWKGNIRELENTLQRAMMNADTVQLEQKDFDFLNNIKASGIPPFKIGQALEPYVNLMTERLERQIILDTLNLVGWNRTEAAKSLKISRKTLFNKMQQYDLEPESES